MELGNGRAGECIAIWISVKYGGCRVPNQLTKPWARVSIVMLTSILNFMSCRPGDVVFVFSACFLDFEDNL